MHQTNENTSSADPAAIERHVATAKAFGKTYRRSRWLLFLASTFLLLFVGLWIRSFFGVAAGLIFFSLPDGLFGDPALKQWVVSSESGTLTLTQVPPIYLPRPGWRWHYIPYAPGGPAGDGGEWTSRFIGRSKCHLGNGEETLRDEDFLGGYPYYWICSVPFWFSSNLLVMVVILAVRRGSAAKSWLLSQEYGSLIQTHNGDASDADQPPH